MLELFITFVKIGCFTIGGGYAMIPLIEEQVVNRKKWVTQEELTDLIAVAQSCPGIFAVNLSIFIGYKLYRTRGALACTLGTTLPSFIIILLIALFFQRFREALHPLLNHAGKQFLEIIGAFRFGPLYIGHARSNLAAVCHSHNDTSLPTIS